MKTSFILISVALLTCGICFADCPPTALPFIDHFGSPDLDSCWTWLDEDTSHWSLTQRPGWVRIVAQAGQDIENSCCLKNKLIRSVSDQNLRITTRLSLSPWMDYQQAGILVFLDQDNYIYAARTYNAGLGGQVVFIHSEDEGSWSEMHTSMTDTVTYLQIDKLGSEYTGYASSDSVQWICIGRFDNDLVADSTVGIGLFALTGREQGIGEIPADFDYFRVDPLPGTNVCGNVSGVWDSTGSPYYVNCNVTVPGEQTLEIGPGVRVAFMGLYTFNVLGTLEAIGTEEDSVVFTTDTGVNPARWDGIKFDGVGCSESSMRYCAIEKGTSGCGGGVMCNNSACPTFTNCTFSGNTAHYGGGVHCDNYSSPTFTNCTFGGNSASGGEGRGGAVSCYRSSSPTFENCTLSGNWAIGWGGGVACYFSSTPTFANCTLSGNSAPNGGTVHCWQASPNFNSTIIAFSGGSGIYFDSYAGVVHCDFFGNTGGNFYGGVGGVPPGLGQIVATNQNGDPCDVYYNIFLDPLFVNSGEGDYHVLSSSPCIDAGDPVLPYDPDSTVADIGAFPFISVTGAGYVTLERPGPPDWDYRLHWTSGAIGRLVFRNVCPQTHGSTLDGAVAAGWTATDFTDSVVFVTASRLTSGSLVTFRLSHPWCSDVIGWNVGDSSGTIDGPLPVELTSFEAVAGNQIVTLRWQTASENDNAYFEIRRDGVRAAQVQSQGNSVAAHEYSWTDQGLDNGVTYTYALVCVDLNGTREELGVRSATPRADVAVISEYALHQNYPNPFNPVTNIAFDLVEDNSVTLTVYEATGRAVVDLLNNVAYTTGRHDVVFDADGLASGVYFCSIKIGRDFTSTKKMLLVR